MPPRTILSICWVLATVVAVGMAAAWMTVGGHREMLLTGEMSGAHHQIGLACETCHAAPAFSGAAAARKALNRTCRNCHGDELQAADDSHPRKKFRNPRMAAYWEVLDARFCTTCHVEHRPETTRKGAVTVAADFCVACHAEGDQDIRTARPSHAGLAFDTCASAGCHNYHDNRALYADFLVKHADQPWLDPVPVHALSARHRTPGPPQTGSLGRSDALAPAAVLADATVLDHWAGSGHAAAGINCTGCHAPDVASGAPLAEIGAGWTAVPPLTVCRDCHRAESETFALGRHGMRQHPRIAPPRDPAATRIGAVLPEAVTAWLADPPRAVHMTVGEARLPMRSDPSDLSLDCGTCHRPHTVDTGRASVEACVSCHDDTHSRSYAGSPHHVLWQAEQGGKAAPGTGVSCATCHMPKVARRGKIFTSHNQNDRLRPNEKMIRPVCLDCHGLGFAMDALADADLVTGNFRGKPAVHVESIEWALRHAASARNTEH
ncbi:MAG: cytochrome c3 family protein [Gammaproteobacteria bacterium]|nr:cytochrome c3 family protein [Gammaproteobacteria bacterium]